MVDNVRAVQLWLDDLVIEVLIVVDCGNLLLFECTHLFEVDLTGLELLLSTIIVIHSVLSNCSNGLSLSCQWVSSILSRRIFRHLRRLH